MGDTVGLLFVSSNAQSELCGEEGGTHLAFANRLARSAFCPKPAAIVGSTV